MQKALMLVLAGVVIGFLVAPEKGSVTQRKISNWFNKETDDAEDLAHDASHALRAKARSVKQDFDDVGEDVKDGLQDSAKSWG